MKAGNLIGLGIATIIAAFIVICASSTAQNTFSGNPTRTNIDNQIPQTQQLLSDHDGSTAYLVAKGREASPGSETDRRSKEKGESTGTGFFVSSDGHLVTNHHVIETCSNIRIISIGGKEISAYIVAKDETNDLAILKTSISPTIVSALGTQVRVGESVFVFGFPFTGILSASGHFTTGTITAITGLADDTRLVQILAPVQPDNSGGPLIDKFGNVVAVIVSKLNALNIAAATNNIPQNIYFAIKSSIVMNFLDSNGVVPDANTKSRELPPEAIAELAKSFTVRVTCN